MGDTDLHDAMRAIADADAAGLLDPALFGDALGFKLIADYAGSQEIALRTVLGIVRHAARHGARTRVERWVFSGGHSELTRDAASPCVSYSFSLCPNCPK